MDLNPESGMWVRLTQEEAEMICDSLEGEWAILHAKDKAEEAEKNRLLQNRITKLADLATLNRDFPILPNSDVISGDDEAIENAG